MPVNPEKVKPVKDPETTHTEEKEPVEKEAKTMKPRKKKNPPRKKITQTKTPKVRNQPEISIFFYRTEREQKCGARVDTGPNSNSNYCKNIPYDERESKGGREKIVNHLILG